MIKSIYKTNVLKPGSPLCIVIVRWKKPIYAPIAPSKLFRVVERNKQDSEEREHLKKMYANYRTHMRSLRTYLAKGLDSAYTDLHKVDDQLVLDHYASIEKENEIFNSKSAENRNQAEEIETAENERLLKLEIVRLENQERERRNKALELVLQAKKDAESFVTRENLDAAIDAVLNERSTFRFAIDIRGNIHEESIDGSTRVLERKSPDDYSAEGKTYDSSKIA